MTTIQTILLTALLFAWLCISISFLVTAIQSFIYDRKRESVNWPRLNVTRSTMPSVWRTC